MILSGASFAFCKRSFTCETVMSRLLEARNILPGFFERIIIGMTWAISLSRSLFSSSSPFIIHKIFHCTFTKDICSVFYIYFIQSLHYGFLDEMWHHAYIIPIQINYTCSINSPFSSSPIMYEVRYQKYVLNGLQHCLGYSHFSDTLLISIYWTRMKIKIGKDVFIVFLLGRRNQTEWTDYCINGYIDLVLACRRETVIGMSNDFGW